MGRKLGSKNKSTLARERDEESKPTVIVPVVKESPKVIMRSDAEFLESWLEGVKKEYKENKKAHEEALVIVNEILKYIRRHRPSNDTKEAINTEAADNSTANQPNRRI